MSHKEYSEYTPSVIEMYKKATIEPLRFNISSTLFVIRSRKYIDLYMEIAGSPDYIGDNLIIGHATVTGLSGRKSVYAVERASISLIYDSITSSYSTNKLKALTTHEFGHALGYFGHDINSTNVNKSIMNPYIDNIWDLWSVNAPTSRDLNHMGNI